VTGRDEQGVRFETLGPQHDRAGFDCGVPALDRYLAQQATQDVRRRVANCFVAAEGARVLGYYTLAATSIALTSLPETVSKKLPRYPTVPAALIGRLAVAQAARGQGLGGAMLMDATARILAMDAAVYALLVDAKDEAADAFYRHHGFLGLADRPRSLFLPVATAERSLKA
jgi:GNAT superfamily N-acetyltransferase